MSKQKPSLDRFTPPDPYAIALAKEAGKPMEDPQPKPSPYTPPDPYEAGLRQLRKGGR